MDRKIAEYLLEIKAVFLRPEEPFTWVSGIKSPVYCDNRLILSYPKIRQDIEIALARLIHQNFPQCQTLMGTSTAGIPHAAIVSTILNLPMGYVRTSSKDHGRQNKIEGKLELGTKVVVVEDLISTASSCLDVVETLRKENAEVLGVASLFTYNMKTALDKFEEAKIKNISVTDYDTLIEVAEEKGYIQAKDIESLLAFRDNPTDNSWFKT